MPDDDCDGFARALAITPNAIGIVKSERLIQRHLQLCALLFKQVTIVRGSAELFRSALCLTNAFPKVRARAQTCGYESMKRKYVSHNHGRDHDHRREHQAGA